MPRAMPAITEMDLCQGKGKPGRHLVKQDTKRPGFGARPTSCARACSGDMYAGEPTKAPDAVMVSRPVNMGQRRSR